MERAVESFDMDNKLKITISNTAPVSLLDLTSALTSFADQYYDYIDNDSKGNCKGALFVTEVSKGSMKFELVAQVLPYFSILAATTPLEAWLNQFTKTVEWLSGKIDKPPATPDKKSLENISRTFAPIAKDSGSSLQLHLENCNNISITYTSNDARQVTESAAREIAKITEKEEHIHKNRLMTWYQTRFDDNAKTGDLVVIDSITAKPLKVVFQNPEDKTFMQSAALNSNKFLPDICFVVDVEVQYLKDKPKLYNILRVDKSGIMTVDD